MNIDITEANITSKNDEINVHLDGINIPKVKLDNLIDIEYRSEDLNKEYWFYTDNNTFTLIVDKSIARNRMDLQKCHIFCIPSAPEFCIYYRINSKLPNMEDGNHFIVGISIKTGKYTSKLCDKDIKNILLKKLEYWESKFKTRMIDYNKYEEKSVERDNLRNQGKLTLLRLLESLSSDQLTTANQRKEIREAVNSYLFGEISYNDFFSLIADIIGEKTLYSIILYMNSTISNTPNPNYSAILDSYGLQTKLNRYNNIDPNHFDIFIKDNARLYPVFLHPNNFTCLGHSKVHCGDYLLIFGGITSKFCLGNSCPKLSEFSEIITLNLAKNKFTKIITNGLIPKCRMYHSSNLVYTLKGPMVLVYGGLHYKEDSNWEFLDDIDCLDIESKSWICLGDIQNDNVGKRILHTSLVYPAFSDIPQDKSVYSKFLVIFGGLMKDQDSQNINPRNDLWCYSIENKSWHSITVISAPNKMNIEIPSPRFGHSCVWVDDNTFYIYGGEGKDTCSTKDDVGIIFNDIWSFTFVSSIDDIDNCNIKGYWELIKSENNSNQVNSSLHTSIMLGIYSNSPSYEKSNLIGTLDSENLKNYHEKILISFGGISKPLVSKYPLNLNFPNKRLITCYNELFEEDSKSSYLGLNFKIFFLNSNKWLFTNFTINSPSPSVSDIINSDNNNIDYLIKVPKISNHISGICCFFNYPSLNRNISIPCILYHGGSFIKSNELQGQSFILSLFGYEPFGLKSNEESNININDFIEKDNNEQILNSNKILKKYLRPNIKNTINIQISFLSSLSSYQSWIFGAIAHLFDNSLSTFVKSNKIELAFYTFNSDNNLTKYPISILSAQNSIEGIIQILKNKDNMKFVLSVTDNGVGLNYSTMMKLFQFGTSHNISSFDFTNSNVIDYLSPRCNQSNQINNNSKYGTGFKMALSRLAPICLIITRTKNLLGVGLYSRSLLELNENSAPYIPVCFWNSQTYEPFIPKNSTLTEHQDNQNMILKFSPFNQPANIVEQFNTLADTGTRFLFVDLNILNQYPDFELIRPFSYINRELNNKFSQENNLDIDNSLEDQLNPLFPLWNNDKDSIDFNLYTYLYWLNLNCTQSIYCQGKLLVPSTHYGQTIFNGIYDFLKKHLFLCVEISSILVPEKLNDGAFALIGKLYNNNNVGIKEAGVLLYYKGRLIRRLEGHFPCIHYINQESTQQNSHKKVTNLSLVTALINVPEWLIPSANKQEFIHEGSALFKIFQTSIFELVEEYLQHCEQPNKLHSWSLERNRISHDNPVKISKVSH
ncbi:kelch motif family protein [Cryptosporidium andersoni]|uniref:Kelch motif family protein n=1 Tax=Cryptosporidium andersoni TaxID=117008 RepID=A0A1J4MP83_9CRYT|nr:kelch motif family protein [Cryptosporidium andersoni]